MIAATTRTITGICHLYVKEIFDTASDIDCPDDGLHLGLIMHQTGASLARVVSKICISP